MFDLRPSQVCFFIHSRFFEGGIRRAFHIQTPKRVKMKQRQPSTAAEAAAAVSRGFSAHRCKLSLRNDGDDEYCYAVTTLLTTLTNIVGGSYFGLESYNCHENVTKTRSGRPYEAPLRHATVSGES